MKKHSAQAKQPTQAEIQTLLKFFQGGQLPQAEVLGKDLVKKYPHVPIIHNVLGSALAGQGKFVEAVEPFKKLVAIDPKSAELHFNLALMQANSGQLEDAVANYRKAATLAPKFVDAHYNLGTALQALGRHEEAAASYRKAIEIQPGFFEAHGNLGAVLQAQGLLTEAIASYRKALAIHPDARGHFNLGTALRNQGLLEEAIASFQNAIAADPNYAEAYSNLGESLWHHGKLNEAVESFNKALAIDPDNPSANYNLAVFLYDNNELERAIPHFERSQFGDWRERVLYCLYKTEQYEAFKERLKHSISASSNISPFLATLSTHYAVNFGTADEYNFCKKPLDFVGHHTIEALAAPNSVLLAELLSDISHAEISQRKQSRLHHGIQSSGNLFKRPEASFQKLAVLIAETIEKYRQGYAKEDCMFIKAFPKNIEFSSSWYVKMQSGGHLTSHIHEEGWISGAVYLAMPKNRMGDEGSIELSTHGDNYPQKHTDFPTKTIAPNVGDVVFFPSSVFHRTIPYSSNEERICIAFDLKPA